MLRVKENSIEKFIHGQQFALVVGGVALGLAVLVAILFFAVSVVDINPNQLHSEDEVLDENLVQISVLVRDENADESISLSPWTILRGSNDKVPTLDLDKAATDKDTPRFVDNFLYFLPLTALFLAILGGLLLTHRLSTERGLFLILIIALFLFIFPTLYEAIGRLDWQGYDQIQSIRNREQRKSVQEVLASFNSNEEMQFVGTLGLLVSFGLWLSNWVVKRGLLQGGYYTDSQEDVKAYFKSKKLRDYVTTVLLLAGAVLLLQWFLPKATASPAKFYNLTYQGLSDGLLLSLVALGLVLIYKATDVINFAHGELMMLGAFIFGEIIVRNDYSITVGLLLTAVAMIGIGVLIERLVLRPLIGEPIISVIMVTIGMSNIIHAIVGMKWKNQAKIWQERVDLKEGFLPVMRTILPSDSGLRKELSTGTYQLFEEGQRLPYSLKYQNIYLVMIVIVVIFLLTLLFKYSKQGIAMRATADDQQAALSMGISVKRIFAIAWGIAALFAGLAGVLVGDLGTGATIDIPNKGLRAFPVIILGGLDSITGAIVGGLMIGLLESYAVGYIDPQIKESVSFIVPAASTKEIIPYVVLILILMFKPYGLFGQERIERV